MLFFSCCNIRYPCQVTIDACSLTRASFQMGAFAGPTPRLASEQSYAFCFSVVAYIACTCHSMRHDVNSCCLRTGLIVVGYVGFGGK